MARKTAEQAQAEDSTIAPIVELRRLEDQEAELEIVGVSPLIVHRWSEKARQQMRDKMSGEKAPARREPKNPEKEAEDATYFLDDGRPGMPAVAFKAAMVEACRFFSNVTMTEVKRLLFVVGEGTEQLVPINGERTIREDTPRVGQAQTDLRYRSQFWPWSATIRVRFPKGIISPASVAALLDAGGRSGVGEWRPGSPKSNTGTYGQFRLVSVEER
jgi:hypothetical protein